MNSTTGRTKDNIDQYANLAAYYDQHGWQRIAHQWISAFDEFVRRKNLTPRRLYDVCCGTGEFLSLLDERFEFDSLAGVDASAEMLDIARGKGIRHAELTLADVRGFRLDQPAELATCQYNSLNCMVEDMDMERVLTSVAESLASGGWFLFDIKMPVFYERHCNFGLVNRPGEFMLRGGHFDRARSIAFTAVEGFMRGDDGRFDRMVFHQIERSWPFADLRSMLDRSGFAAIEFIHDTSNVTENDADETERLFVAAQRRG